MPTAATESRTDRTAGGADAQIADRSHSVEVAPAVDLSLSAFGTLRRSGTPQRASVMTLQLFERSLCPLTLRDKT